MWTREEGKIVRERMGRGRLVARQAFTLAALEDAPETKVMPSQTIVLPVKDPCNLQVDGCTAYHLKKVHGFFWRGREGTIGCSDKKYVEALMYLRYLPKYVLFPYSYMVPTYNNTIKASSANTMPTLQYISTYLPSSCVDIYYLR
jgi:hypothetical protein